MAQETRATGDQTDLKITWSGDIDFRDVTAIVINVYNNAAKQTLIETLTGAASFDPATYFPIIDANWIGTRYWQVVITRGAIAKPLPEIHTWVQT